MLTPKPTARGLSPAPAEQSAALLRLTFATQNSSGVLVSRTQLAAMLGVNPMTLVDYERSGRLPRANQPGETPALYRWRDFSDALRYVIQQGFLQQFAEIVRASSRLRKTRKAVTLANTSAHV